MITDLSIIPGGDFAGQPAIFNGAGCPGVCDGMTYEEIEVGAAVVLSLIPPYLR